MLGYGRMRRSMPEAQLRFRILLSCAIICANARVVCHAVYFFICVKVRLYSILMEDVRELKEFVVKHCRAVCFSGGGQYFSFAHNAQVRKDRLSISRVIPDAFEWASLFVTFRRCNMSWHSKGGATFERSPPLISRQA